MSKDEMLARLASLTDDQYARIAPFLQADMAILDEGSADADAWQTEIEAGLNSAATEPVLEHSEVLAHVRMSLSKSSE